MEKKGRRHKLLIYYDVLSAIKNLTMEEGEAKLTRIQQRSNLSYDKMTRYLAELHELNMISTESTVSITETGIKFLHGFESIKDLIMRTGL